MNDPDQLFQIGEVAERVGLSLRTVRYWEEMRLVRPSARSAGGFRLYSNADLERFLLAKRMRPLGLTLEEMGELADLIEHSAHPSGLPNGELRGLVETLRSYAKRADEAIEKLERELSSARQLRLRIGERLGRSEGTLEHDETSPDLTPT